ncbi:bifunctional PIG-L family deacetylase/class I SAM-dependent methyltransferase [Subtercola boreus]|uniref:Methyltransferase domain-containing protein n=1 Tax=Subtercola boreus TaxID=120213 RepID=A0A3E0WC13_9MICO|nr:bifunctional PIG-L family deacetylase/class I SAM-dependent methyltransferase [Subtercola boreus]RFA21123.1 hypothetical protein B7R24_06930 [Subtercola boreus]RFA21506.1 hypothetical protein B7R23_06875 [Subtercola boreus]RFA27476.1 hypothetical protein B7R25_07000 [Subtercola boreus]
MVTFDSRDPGTTSGEWMLDPRLAALPVFALDGVERMFVVAAHPDDETLGAGALIATAGAQGIPTAVVIVTDGSASHPSSPTTPQATLAATRAAEATAAVRLLNPAATLTFLGLPDGRIDNGRGALRSALAEVLAPVAASPARTPSGGRTLLVCPWRGDEHPDHRIVGELCAELAAGSGGMAAADATAEATAAAPDTPRIELVEYPIWLWHWSSPADPATPWTSFAALYPTPEALAAKRRALAAHRSQVEPLSPAAGDEALLNPTFLQHFDRAQEVYIVNTPQPAPGAAGPGTTASLTTPQLPGTYFDATYRANDDPWGFTTRWYEERKRALTTASLPRQHFARTLEIGCSIGVLTEQLAPRTDALLALDIAPAAIDRARARLAAPPSGTAQHASATPHVTLRVADVATDFPEGTFDLVLLSEVGYYFDAGTLDRVLGSIATALTDDGVFVACHWRHPVADYLQTGDGVHRLIAEAAARAGWTLIAHHLEDDFVLDVYAPDGRSVAARTGLV